MTIPDWLQPNKGTGLEGKGPGREPQEPGIWQGPAEGSAPAIPQDVVLVAIAVLIASASFGLGILADRGIHPAAAGAAGGKGVWVETLPAGGAAASSTPIQAPGVSKTSSGGATQAAAAAVAVTPASGEFVASKSGTAYYLPTCASAKRIKDENKVWFATAADAQKYGYTPAKNCPGL